MLYSRLAAILCVGVSVFAVAACSDPGSVGAELGASPPSEGTPQTTNAVVSSTSSKTVASQTGIASDDGPWRFLTGTVDDDLAGTIETEGYVDFDAAVDPPDALADAPDAELNADLQLTRSYVHGDTTGDLTVELYDLKEADMEGAQADETFQIDGSSSITSVSFAPTASEVTISLDDWIDSRKSNLSGDSFSSFHGFRLTSTSGDAVVGFEHDSATLQVTTSSDTATFPANQSFTNIQQLSSPSPLPDNRALLLDGIGTFLSFDWSSSSSLNSLATEELDDRLNRAVLKVPIDTSFPPKNDDFVRPAPSGYRILAIPNAESPDCSALDLDNRSLRDAGSACGLAMRTNPGVTQNQARTTGSSGVSLFDRWFSTGRSPFPTFRVEIANRGTPDPTDAETTRRGLPSTMPVAVRTDLATADTSDLPRAILTTTPL